MTSTKPKESKCIKCKSLILNSVTLDKKGNVVSRLHGLCNSCYEKFLDKMYLKGSL